MTDTSELLAQLTAGIEQLTTSDAWTAYLATQAKFHNYSAGNCQLIAIQRPYATRVAGYRAWQSMGRQVRKGETSIRILAPLAVKDKETGEYDVKGFRSVGVFDIAQTDGDALEEIAQNLTGNAPSDVFARLSDVATGLGFTVAVETIEEPGVNGYCSHADKKIVVSSDNDGAQQVKTLAHEISHAILHGDGDKTARELRELEAESSAYVICSALGLETGGYSFGYVAGWLGSGPAAVAGVRASQARIHQASSKVLDQLAKNQESEVLVTA